MQMCVFRMSYCIRKQKRDIIIHFFCVSLQRFVASFSIDKKDKWTVFKIFNASFDILGADIDRLFEPQQVL